MKKLLFALLFLAACNSPEQKKISFAQTLLSNQKDSTAIVGTDTIHFTGTPRTVYDYVASSVSHKALDTTIVIPPISPAQSFAFQMQDISAVDYVRPDNGANQFYDGNGQQSPIPDKSKSFSTLNDDKRFNWIDLQTKDGVINGGPLDNAISKCIANGWKLSFGVVSCDSGNPNSVYPSFAGTTKTPAWNSEQYLSAVERFLQSLADYIKTNNYAKYISSIDIRLLGNWGEFHYFGISAPYATSASIKRIIDAHIKAFPDIQLISVISAYQSNSNIPTDAAAYLLMAKNNVGPVGIRSDHLGDSGNFDFDTKLNTTVYNGINFQTEIFNRWKTAPIKGELLNDLSKINSSSPYSDLPREVNGLHFSQFSNSNEARRNGSGASSSQISASDANLLSASKIAGARIGFTSATIKNGQLTLNWSNTGIAPVYDNWDVYLICGSQQIKSSATIKGMQPGSQTSSDQLPPGNYSLSVIIKDPTGYRSAYPLLNKNRLSDGSYKIGDLK